MNNNDQISLNIKLARMSIGYSGHDMAVKLNIKDSSYNHYESGRNVHVMILGAICEEFNTMGLNIKVDDILFKKASITLNWQ
jgi:transcriptional regulator with XRE-family HTH domain